MKKKIEITLKCTTEDQAADMLEEIAAMLRGARFKNAPNDMREFEDVAGPHGYHYEVHDNDGTDIYGNELEEESDS